MGQRISFDEWTEQLRHTLYRPEDYIDYREIQNKCDSESIKYLQRWSEKHFTKREFVNICKENPKFLEFSVILFATHFKKNEQPIWWLDKRKGVKGKVSVIRDYNEKSTDFNSGSDARVAYEFLEKTSVFNELKKMPPTSMYAFILGIEAGMDTNSRKNRTGEMMEKEVEEGLKKIIPESDICTQCTKKMLPDEWQKNFPEVSEERRNKKYDFVVKVNEIYYAIEVNFFTKKGSKQTEIAREYTDYYDEFQTTTNLRFVWITDGNGVECNPVKKYYEGGRTLFCLEELYNGTVKKYLKGNDNSAKKKL